MDTIADIRRLSLTVAWWFQWYRAVGYNHGSWYGIGGDDGFRLPEPVLPNHDGGDGRNCDSGFRISERWSSRDDKSNDEERVYFHELDWYW